MRDRFHEDDFFESTINDIDEFYGDRDILKLFRDKYLNDNMTRTLDNGFRDLRFLREGLLSVQTGYISLKYCRGDDLSSIYESHFKEMLKHYEVLSIELAKGNPQKVIYGFQDDLRRPVDQHSVYVWLAWCLCFEINFETISGILPQLCSAGQDRLTDSICASIVPNWVCGDGCGYPEIFGLLDEVLLAENQDRAALVKAYLDDWPKYIGQVNGSSIGFICSCSGKGVNTRAHLIKAINDNYVGYWAWEAAMVVKFLGIDDSSFKENEFYPYDLVHFTAPLNDQGFNVKGGLGLNTSTIKKVESVDPKQRTDLSILNDIDVSQLKGIKQNTSIDFYQAFLPKKDVSLDDGFDFITDSAIRYSVSLVSDSSEIEAMKNELEFVKGNDDWLINDRLELNMNQLVDQCGMAVTYEFMDEVFLSLDNGFNDSSLIYCSRHKSNKVPPLMILRYAKFYGSQMLSVFCMIRDVELTYKDVSAHWLWLVNRYQNALS